MLQELTTKAQHIGFKVNEDQVKNNFEYFKHQLRQCRCGNCTCGKCRCKPTSFRYNVALKKRCKKSFTPTQSLSVNQNYYETSQYSYREMSSLPQQYQTSNRNSYQNYPMSTRSISVQPQERRVETPFEGVSLYRESYQNWKRSPLFKFKAPQERHTGEMKPRMLQSSYQKQFVRFDKDQEKPMRPDDQLHVMQAAMNATSYYRSAFRRWEPIQRAKGDKERKLKDQESEMRVNVPFNGDTIQHSTYTPKEVLIFKMEVIYDQEKSYIKGKFLGKGGFAKCYEVKDDKDLYAAKVIAKATLTKSRAKQKLMSEIKIHRSMLHKHIVRFHHFFEDSENVYIILELCHNQTLNDLLRRRKRLTEIEVQCYLLQIMSALRALHKNKVIHRDLKLGNLFLSDRMEVKLGDFGLATKLDFDGDRRRTICGTPNYIAPEILEGKHGHSYEVDIWSFGVIAYTLLIGKPPFETSDVKSTYRRIKMNAYQFPETVFISQAAKQLIQKLLVTDPSKRLTLDEIQAHEFFVGNIPTALPVSTLACPPSSTYMRQFNKSGSQHENKPQDKQEKLEKYGSQMELKLINTMSSVHALKPNVMYKSVDRLGMKINYNEQFQQQQQQLQAPTVTVRKWVDYSSKYGLGYVLENNQCGVYFNDSTKILTQRLQQIMYVDRNGDEKFYQLDQCPEELNKKVTLLTHFKGYLLQNNDETDEQSKVYVKKWLKAKHAIIFRLSDKTVQVIFNDSTQVILTQQLKMVTYVDKESNKSTHILNAALESDNAQMVKRLKYTKEVLSQMLGQQQVKKDGISTQPLQERSNNPTQDRITTLTNNFCSTSRLKNK